MTQRKRAVRFLQRHRSEQTQQLGVVFRIDELPGLPLLQRGKPCGGTLARSEHPLPNRNRPPGTRTSSFRSRSASAFHQPAGKFNGFLWWRCLQTCIFNDRRRAGEIVKRQIAEAAAQDGGISPTLRPVARGDQQSRHPAPLSVLRPDVHNALAPRFLAAHRRHSDIACEAGFQYPALWPVGAYNIRSIWIELKCVNIWDQQQTFGRGIRAKPSRANPAQR